MDTDGGKSRWIDDLVEDLLQRQVDTIVTEGITGRSMPHPAIALRDINNSYLRKLRSFGLGQRDAASDLEKHAFDTHGWLLPRVEALEWLITRACKGLNESRLAGADRSVLQRIVSTCTSLLPTVAKLQSKHPGVFSDVADARPHHDDLARLYSFDWKQPLPAVSLRREELAAISKAWELGSDTVALQTVALLDGDIITRVTEQYTGESHGIVRQIHREAVNLSFSTWETITRSIGSFVEALFNMKA